MSEPLDLESIKARAEAAKAGLDDASNYPLRACVLADRSLADIPALVAEVERLRVLSEPQPAEMTDSTLTHEELENYWHCDLLYRWTVRRLITALKAERAEVERLVNERNRLVTERHNLCAEVERLGWRLSRYEADA